MQNLDKPTTSLVNTDKVSIGTTWDTWTTSWDDETRTWDELSQLIENASKTAYGAPLWNNQMVWQLSLPWQVDSAIMTNFEKP